jgi:hypothetical protein
MNSREFPRRRNELPRGIVQDGSDIVSVKVVVSKHDEPVKIQ